MCPQNLKSRLEGGDFWEINKAEHLISVRKVVSQV